MIYATVFAAFALMILAAPIYLFARLVAAVIAAVMHR